MINDECQWLLQVMQVLILNWVWIPQLCSLTVFPVRSKLLIGNVSLHKYEQYKSKLEADNYEACEFVKLQLTCIIQKVS